MINLYNSNKIRNYIIINLNLGSELQSRFFAFTCQRQVMEDLLKFKINDTKIRGTKYMYAKILSH